ncbi:hypothetical protein KAH94_04330 [bacterium]|nr:hypothetical protein [bacterium]
MNIYSYFHVIKELVKTDLIIFKKIALDKWVDMFIWISTMTLVFAYVMPSFGLVKSYGAFMVASMCSTAGLFQAFAYMAEMVADFEGDKIITYHFTLPIPSWLIFIRFIIYYTIAFMFLGLLVLPAGKIMLWNSFSLTNVHYGKYALIFIVTNVFYAILALWTTSFVRSLVRIDSVWMRIIYPLWFLGCFQFSWKSLHQASPLLAYIDLINPITYISEGTRAAILGQTGSLNFWWCIIAIIGFIVFGGWHAITRLKKRLDFV